MTLSGVTKCALISRATFVTELHTTAFSEEAVDTAHPEGLKLQKRYRQHRQKLFVFLARGGGAL